ncbi:endonuclease/exonuclease/phosphatase family protein [Pseudomonas sp. SLFW]|uniref:endonuclease/exonuclease/phosphatase family protein n=1 Tax=Pseudomonas sp. SLFW TaxID=2683259 RepID=UPI0014134874|nr:endonuclease/exonuclease/phosphatase family protein [Pseudomonas sp. SLFW]NBB11698.1 endonuclease [Pseudomonas sp. SLFW]
MPVNPTIRDYISRELLSVSRLQDFETQFEVVVTDIATLLSSAPADAGHTSAWLAYALSQRYMRSANEAAQRDYAERLTSVFRRLYNDARFIALIAAAPARVSYPMLLNFYHLHHAFIMNGLRAAQGPETLDHGDALRMLQIIVGAAHGPWLSRIRLHGGIRDYHHARMIDDAQGTRIELGRAPSSVHRSLSVATWNMQGTSEASDAKWRTFVLPLARENTLIALQEAGVRPASARHVTDLAVADQFGAVFRVEQYLWEAGSVSRPEQYQLFFLDVQRLRVNLAVVVASRGDIEVVTPVVISDGLPPRDGAPPNRPALGVVIRRRHSRAESITVYSFHAISGGGPNAPRVLREVSWHTPTPVALLGDFNRDPREDPTGSQPARGPWISPPEIGQLVLPGAATHPSTQPQSILDYAVVNGTSIDPAPGQVSAAGPSDHRAASFTLAFPE